MSDTPYVPSELNQLIVDKEISPNNILHHNKVTNVNAYYFDDTGNFHFNASDNNGNPILVSQEQYDTWKSEKTIQEWSMYEEE